jgi:hypothetical protein
MQIGIPKLFVSRYARIYGAELELLPNRCVYARYGGHRNFSVQAPAPASFSGGRFGSDCVRSHSGRTVDRVRQSCLCAAMSGIGQRRVIAAKHKYIARQDLQPPSDEAVRDIFSFGNRRSTILSTCDASNALAPARQVV